MCTAATYKTKNFYFGRSLDNDFSYHEEVVISPRTFPLSFRLLPTVTEHYAIIGMAHVADGYPLYYDAMNEKGLCMAGLNFVGNAVYSDPIPGTDNIAQFELIPWILGMCANVQEAKKKLRTITLTNTPFSDDLPPSQLHWIIADREEAITVESVEDGLHVYDNPVGVLTNNPPFPEQLFRLNDFMHLSRKQPKNHFSPKLNLTDYSRGMGAMGLPGDLSSQSRFIRVSFVKENSVSDDTELQSVSQFFHILGSVDQQRGCCEIHPDTYEITIYTSCCNADRGIYYYTTYDNPAISAVDMHREDLNRSDLIRIFPITKTQINFQN